MNREEWMSHEKTLSNVIPPNEKLGRGRNGRKSRSPCFVQLAFLVMKFIKWLWKLCSVNPQRLVVASSKIEGPKNAKEKQAIKTCNHLGALRSKQVIWMSGVAELEEYFPGQCDLAQRILIIVSPLP